MVKVPNLSGLTRTTASSSIVSNGLVPLETGSTDTADDSLNQKIASQNPSFDSLVDYETNVSYTYYNFSFTPYSFTPYSFTPTAYTFTPTAYTFTPTAYTFTPYSFTPYSFTPVAATGVWYTHCSNPASGADGSVVGPYFWPNKTCSQVQQLLTQMGELGPGNNFNCAPGPEEGPSPIAAATCSPVYSFTPYSFTPFTPTPAYTFTPYTFTPYSFTPTYSFAPLTVCIDEDTLIQIVGYENSVEFKAAKDIVLGDKIWSITWDGLLDDLQDPGASTIYPENLKNVKRVQSEIVQISPSTKDTTLYFNGDKTKRFTPEEKVLIKRLDSHIFVEAKTVTENDFIFEPTDSGMVATPVSSLDYIEEIRNVFKFNAFPVDTIIAGNMVVHNSKV